MRLTQTSFVLYFKRVNSIDREIYEGDKMGKWYRVETQKDIEQLMSTYGDFHDACIVSLNFQSGAFVDDESAMHFGSPEDHVLSVVFQCQWEPKTVELQFIGLRQLHLVGWQDNYLCDILDAYLIFHDNLLPGEPNRVIVWSDNSCFDPAKIGSTIQEPSDTYIVANALKWRIVKE